MDTPQPDPSTLLAEDGSSGDSAFRERGVDRRQRPTPRLSRFTIFGGRRRSARRSVEQEGSFVDRYTPGVLALILWVTLMNLGDSFFTLTHLQSGGIELNPVAAALLRTGRFGFIFWKALIITLALLVLTLHKNFSLARIGLWVAAIGYTALNIYHLTLF